jgi:hypothetical protein
MVSVLIALALVLALAFSARRLIAAGGCNA